MDNWLKKEMKNGKTNNCIGLQSKHSKQIAHQRSCKSAKANQRSLSDYGSFPNRTKKNLFFLFESFFYQWYCEVNGARQNETDELTNRRGKIVQPSGIKFNSQLCFTSLCFCLLIACQITTSMFTNRTKVYTASRSPNEFGACNNTSIYPISPDNVLFLPFSQFGQSLY